MDGLEHSTNNMFQQNSDRGVIHDHNMYMMSCESMQVYTPYILWFATNFACICLIIIKSDQLEIEKCEAWTRYWWQPLLQ